jgi:hypothetical protein
MHTANQVPSVLENESLIAFLATMERAGLAEMRGYQGEGRSNMWSSAFFKVVSRIFSLLQYIVKCFES